MAFFHSGHSGGGRVAPSKRAEGAQATFIMAAEVGRFFQDLRRALRLSQLDAARRLATRPDIVMALETGDIHSLPPWPETCRIVRTYTSLAGLDPRPVLFSLEQLRATGVRLPPPKREHRMALPRLPNFVGFRQSVAGLARVPERVAQAASKRREAASGPRQKRPHQHQTAKRVLFGLSLPVALLVLVTQTSVLEAAVSRMPQPVARLVRGAQEYIAVKMAPVRNGMRWIEVNDPRSRRADKLQTAAQSD